MNALLKEHYLQTGPYTYAGPYKDYFRSLPDDPKELGDLNLTVGAHVSLAITKIKFFYCNLSAFTKNNLFKCFTIYSVV